MRVDEAVAISLPERTDRREHLMAHLPRPWPFPRLQIADGIRAAPPPWFTAGPGAYGCAQAHLAVLRSAWERSVESTLILEDDAMFAPDFTDRWRKAAACVPKNWAMVMLGGQHHVRPQAHGFSLVRCNDTRRTHAYIIRLRAIPLLIRTWSHSSTHIDQALLSFQTAAHVYAPTEFLVGQAGGYSDVDGITQHADERFWI